MGEPDIHRVRRTAECPKFNQTVNSNLIYLTKNNNLKKPGIKYKNLQKMMGTFYKVIQKSSYKTGQLAKKRRGGGLNYDDAPRAGDEREKREGKGSR